jgi:hypothetical protein
MKTVTRLIYATVAVLILSACVQKKELTQCATPTLTPSSKSGPAGQDVKVTIETKTLGASLSWSDDPNIPPTPTGPHIINGPKGDAITVYGRTMRAMAFKTGMTDSPIVEGTYPAN